MAQSRLNRLLQYGLKAAPQGPIKVEQALSDYINSYFDDFYAEGFFNDIDEKNEYHEGDIVNIGLHFILKNVRPYAASCSEA